MFGRHAFIVSLGIIAAGAAAAAAWAQGGAGSFPDRPIRVIVSVPAGGGVDTVTRLVTAKMQTILGQPMVVENQGRRRRQRRRRICLRIRRPTATRCWPRSRRRSRPIRCSTSRSITIRRSSCRLRSCRMCPTCFWCARISRPRRSQELIAYAKANPGKLNYASQGIGTTSHTHRRAVPEDHPHQDDPRALQRHRAGGQPTCSPAMSI